MEIDYTALTDEGLAAIAAEDEIAMEHLYRRYKGFVRNKARSYYLIGADREDIIQEGMIGLYKAVRDYDVEKPASFKLFAEICITRQMITAIRMATRQKHIPLNSYTSFYKSISGDDGDKQIIDVIANERMANPEELLISREDRQARDALIERLLSDFEAAVLDRYLMGKSYAEIAEEIGRSAKSIDNALQRIKRKLEKIV